MSTYQPQRILGIILSVALALISITPFVGAQDLGLEVADGNVSVHWDAATGGTTLTQSFNLNDPIGWTGTPAPSLTEDGRWEAQLGLPSPKAFFRLEAAGPPVAPPNLRVAQRDGGIRIEWDSTPDAASYTVYVGTGPGVGPGDHTASYSTLLVNYFHVVALNPGDKVFVSVVGLNASGEGAGAVPVEAVTGPVGTVSGLAVQSFTTQLGDLFEVIAEGAVISLQALNNSDAQAFEGTADSNGNFRIPDVPVGNYNLSYQYNGQAGGLATPVIVKEEGAVIAPLQLAFGPQPPTANRTLLGKVRHSDGSPPRFDLPEFGIHERPVTVIDFASGNRLTVDPDRHGAFALTDILPDYPITVTVTFKQLQAVAVIQQPAAGAGLQPVDIQFTEILPRAHRITAFQNGHEVQCIAPGIPVTFVAEVDNPDALTEEPHWIAEFNGKTQLSTDPSPSFTFNQPSGPPEPGLADAQDSGMARIRFLPTRLSLLGLPAFDLRVDPLLFNPNCWSGVATVWDPALPNELNPATPATMTLSRSVGASPLPGSTSQTNGFFQIGVHPSTAAPYILRVDKPGHMRFLWPFEFQLPLEADFSVIPATTYNADQGGAGIVINHPSGARLTLPVGSVEDTSGTYNDTVVIEMVYLAMKNQHPLPPNPEVRDGLYRGGIFAEGAVWFSLRKPTGGVLTTTPAATLRIPSTNPLLDPTLKGYHQDETTAYFERWGTGPGNATNVGTGLYEIPLGAEGLFMIGSDQVLNELIVEADRSLNYPFEVLVGFSNFPVRIDGFCQNSFGHLYVPRTISQGLKVLDLRLAPGRRFTDPTNPATLIPSFTKEWVYSKPFVPLTPPAIPPAIAPHWEPVSLAHSEPNLKAHPTDTTVHSITDPNHFLSRGVSNNSADDNSADAADYYAQIKAPPTLKAWRALNGLPARFGGPLPSVPADDYSTAYYYNLGDLGFARAQTMRVRTSSDGQPDVAFAVTNYKALEDARCGRGSVATVCMDFALRKDKDKLEKTRYTRFYVYDGKGDLLDCADLDGAGPKCVPNLCVTCHGGSFFTTGASPDLGSRFLPFDIESYSFHPKWDLQPTELAKMNAGVLKTNPTIAVKDVVEGWYAGPDPNANPLTYDQDYVPLGWAADPALYSDMFKGSCRVCHITRETPLHAQFYELSNFSDFGYGSSQACGSLDMPHAQRTWSVFWGSRSAVNLGFFIPDMPSLLGTAAGVFPCPCPDYPVESPP